MKLLYHTAIPVLFFSNAFAQEMPKVEVKSIDYVWERKAGDNRLVFVRDTAYQEVLERSFQKAAEERWNTSVPAFNINVNKLPALRSQPKFNTSVSDADSSKHYIFLQLFDKTLPANLYNLLFTAGIEVRYKLIKAGTTHEDKLTSFKIMFRNPAPGQIIIRRYPFHPSQFKLLCDTIAAKMLNEETKNEREIWLEPACAFTNDTTSNASIYHFQFGGNRQTLSVAGENGFTITQDSVNDIQTGKKRHGGENTIGGLLTFFANVDTDKKRSTLHKAEHSFSEGSTLYRAYVNYMATKVAERHRVKDDDGFKSVEVGEYQHGWRSVSADAKHVITINNDTASMFNIRFNRVEEHFTKMWDGRDTATIESMPVAVNNYQKLELEMQGTIDKDRFVLSTSDGGNIKKLKINDEEVFSFSCNYGSDGVLKNRGLNERQLRVAILLCLLSEKYYQYATI